MSVDKLHQEAVRSPGNAGQLPRVTIALPTLNRVHYFSLALDSALRQDYPNLEIIVSNNASTDNTGEYLKAISDPRLSVLNQISTLSMIDNWNACLSASKGKYFLLLSDDDILQDGAISALVNGYEDPDNETTPGIVYGGGRIIDAKGETVRCFNPSPDFEAAGSMILSFFQGRRDIWLCGILYRTSEVRPGFPRELTLVGDSAIWITSAAKFGYVKYVPGDIVRYRVHQNATAKAPLQLWTNEVTALGELAINELGKIRPLTDAYVGELRAGVRKINAQYVAGRIKGMPDAGRLKQISFLLKNRQLFNNLDHGKLLVRTLITLTLGKQKAWFKWRRRPL